MQKYRSVVLTRKGPPEVLQVVETDLRDPEPGEARNPAHGDHPIWGMAILPTRPSPMPFWIGLCTRPIAWN